MKLKFLFSLPVYAILAFSILSLGACQNDDTDDNPGENPDDYTYMSAIIDGQPYTDLKPLAYPFNGVATLIDNSIDAKYLKLQGSHNDYSISLLISENHWGTTGTFDLDPQLFPTQNGHYGHIVAGLGDFTNDYFSGTTGSITITKFDLATREFEGTFNLEYYRENDDNGTQVGPLYVTDGTLDFPLDNEEFE